MTFAALNLHPKIQSALDNLGFQKPTPIQVNAIPEVLGGQDLLASASTGTGKTAAFLLPAIQRLADGPKTKGPQVLVVLPTRELAIQVADHAKKFCQNLPHIKIVSIFGGVPYPAQNQQLSRPYNILIATPGRLIDHLERGKINLSNIEMLVLDEADRLLDMGFIDPIKTIAAKTPVSRQTLMFSATLEKNILKLAGQLLNDPLEVRMEDDPQKNANIEQRLYLTDNVLHKIRLLDHILREPNVEHVIIFTSTKRFADELSNKLYEEGHPTGVLHGDMNQRQRTRTITKIREGKIKILIATDVAARGIDISTVSHVVNFDIPMTAQDYVHRIGRTGRAGKKGIAMTFVQHREVHQTKQIEKYTGKTISFHVIPGMEPQLKPRPGSAQPKGKPSRKWAKPGFRKGGPGGSKQWTTNGPKKRGTKENKWSSGDSRDNKWAPRGAKSSGDSRDNKWAPRGANSSGDSRDNKWAPKSSNSSGDSRDNKWAPRGAKQNKWAPKKLNDNRWSPGGPPKRAKIKAKQGARPFASGKR